MTSTATTTPMDRRSPHQAEETQCSVTTPFTSAMHTGSSKVFRRPDPHKQSTNPPDVGAPTLAVNVRVRGKRLWLVIAPLLVFILATMGIFSYGIVLDELDAESLTSQDLTEKLDNLNSYSGNVASMVGYPLEYFVAMAAQLVVLHLMAASVLRPEATTMSKVATLALGLAIGYLLNNGFNALNVQPKYLDVRPFISTVDLAETSEWPTSFNRTSAAEVVPEAQTSNAVINTILRNAHIPRVTNPGTGCDSPFNDSHARFFNVEYGFPQQSWLKGVVPTAPEAKRLRLQLEPNATVAGADDNKNNAQSLPMNATLAAHLLLDAFDLLTVDLKTVLGPAADKSRYKPVDLLPPETTRASEAEKKKWLSQIAPRYFSALFPSAQGKIEFAHVNVTDDIAFDAVTFEIEINVTADEYFRPAKASANLWDIGKVCGSDPRLCTLLKPSSEEMPLEVNVQTRCTRAQTRRGAKPDEFRHSAGLSNGMCGQESNSIMISSRSRRVVADEVHERKADNKTSKVDTLQVTGLRKVFTFTLGRLSWQLVDLAKRFRAHCWPASDKGGDPTACHGLAVYLDDPTAKDLTIGKKGTDLDELLQRLPKKYVIIGAEYLPITEIKLSGNLSSWTRSLVRLDHVVEKTPTAQGVFSVADDLLLPHNVKKLQSLPLDPRRRDQDCYGLAEERIQHVLNNHLYIEDGLQVSYTAGLYFLLQRGVVLEAIDFDSPKETLKFRANLSPVQLVVSIPLQNVVLTIVGCVVLCALAIWVVVKQHLGHEQSPLRCISDPHLIAQVMLDDSKFPSVLLDRRLVEETVDLAWSTTTGHEPEPIEAFAIEGLSLQPVAMTIAAGHGDGDVDRVGVPA